MNFYRKEPELREWLTDEEANTLKTISQDDMTLWREVCSYQGFDVKKVLLMARRNYNSYMAAQVETSLTTTYIIGGMQKVFSYTNKEDMAKDLHFLFFLFAQRGCDVGKIRAKSNDDTGAVLDWLIEKYQIDVDKRSSGTTLGPNVITLQQLTACFPTCFADIYHAGYAKAIVSLTDLGLPSTVSKAILCPMIVCMVPPSCVILGRNVHMVVFCLHVLMDDILHRRPSDQTPLVDILAYYRASYKLSCCPREVQSHLFE